MQLILEHGNLGHHSQKALTDSVGKWLTKHLSSTPPLSSNSAKEAKKMKYPRSQSPLQLVVPIWQFWPMKHKQTFPGSLGESSYFLDGRRRPSGATIPLLPAMDRNPGAEMAILQPWLKSQESAEWRPRSGWVTERRSTVIYPLHFLSWTLLRSFIFVYLLLTAESLLK